MNGISCELWELIVFAIIMTITIVCYTFVLLICIKEIELLRIENKKLKGDTKRFEELKNYKEVD